ncbi:MAG: SGNH/GDSL hydrolase family protein, partial [Bosea sp. (in: a-proteobacteria)]
RGVGASSWAATYPEVMQRELVRLRPGARIDIHNAGSNGEMIPGQIARMEQDALALKPALVIWQLGSNDVVWPWGGIGQDTEADVIATIRMIKAAGADVILMDLQNSPLVAGARLRRAMLELTARAARTAGAGHFQRYRLLEQAVQAGTPLGELTSWDQLHNTDAAYDCTGRALARAIHAATR